MKGTGCCIIILLIIAGFAMAAGCTTRSSPDTMGSVPAAPVLADAGFRIITENNPPFNYPGGDGKATGASTDVVNGILSRLNQTGAIEILPWSEGYSLAQAGPRVALYSTGRTADRENLFRWVGPIGSFDYVFYARNGTTLSVNSLEAAKKAGSIAVVQDDARYQFLQQNNFTHLVTCDNDTGCLRDLMAGTADMWLGSSATSASVARDAGIDPAGFTALYEVRSVPLYIAFSPDTPDSDIARWQHALDSMKQDGTFAAIERSYGLATPETPSLQGSAGTDAGLALGMLSTATDGKLREILRSYEVMAVTSEAQSGDWQAIRPMLATLEAKEPDTRTWYARPDGSYYTVADNLTSANLKSRLYFPVVLGGNESVGAVVVSYSTGKNAGIVAVPVISRGKVTGVLGASVYLDTLTDTLRDSIPRPYSFYAINTAGTFALNSDKAQIVRNITTIGPDTSFGQALDQIRTQYAGSAEYDDGGIHYAAQFTSSPLTGWRFVVAWPETVNSTTVPGPE